MDPTPAKIALANGNYELALKLWSELAISGDSEACYWVASIYYLGLGTQKDNEKALRWFTRAAEGGEADAQYNLGVMYRLGEGVTKDPEQAAKWYKLAATQQHCDAEYNLGNLYMTGEGVSFDIQKCVEYTSRAAEHGSIDGAYKLAHLILDSENTNEHSEKVEHWLKVAAEGGHQKAQFELGIILFLLNKNGATNWIGRSVASGYDPAKKLMKHILEREIPIFESKVARFFIMRCQDKLLKFFDLSKEISNLESSMEKQDIQEANLMFETANF